MPLVELGIKTIKFKGTFEVLNYFIPANPKAVENESRVIGRHRNFLHLYEKQLPFLGKCLARSMSLWFLLAKKGINTELKFGMKKDNKSLLAHCWLEVNGKALITESERKENYISFNESILTKITDSKELKL